MLSDEEISQTLSRPESAPNLDKILSDMEAIEHRCSRPLNIDMNWPEQKPEHEDPERWDGMS